MKIKVYQLEMRRLCYLCMWHWWNIVLSFSKDTDKLERSESRVTKTDLKDTLLSKIQKPRLYSTVTKKKGWYAIGTKAGGKFNATGLFQFRHNVKTFIIEGNELLKQLFWQIPHSYNTLKQT